jgi:hypothetical protein
VVQAVLRSPTLFTEIGDRRAPLILHSQVREVVDTDFLTRARKFWLAAWFSAPGGWRWPPARLTRGASSSPYQQIRAGGWPAAARCHRL